MDIDGANFLLLNESTLRNSTTLRLVDGYTEWEGRLEVRPDNESEWGTVCEVVRNYINTVATTL